MVKNNTITLSGKELGIIEKLIAKHGNLVSLAMIYNVIGQRKNRQEIQNLVFGLVKKGWLIRIKRGVFIISDIASRGLIDLNQLTIAQIINQASYVSFEAAWQYHGLFDQYLKTIVSISRQKSYQKKFSDWNFKYIKVKEGLFAGYQEHDLDGRLIKIATNEKVILDFLAYRRTINNIDLIIEKLKDYQSDFNIEQLVTMSHDYSITTTRTLGVILDWVGINSEQLYQKIKHNKNHSFMTASSDLFNAKWRIYTDRQLHLINNAKF